MQSKVQSEALNVSAKEARVPIDGPCWAATRGIEAASVLPINCSVGAGRPVVSRSTLSIGSPVEPVLVRIERAWILTRSPLHTCLSL